MVVSRPISSHFHETEGKLAHLSYFCTKTIFLKLAGRKANEIYPKKLLELISEVRKDARFKSNIQESIKGLTSSKKQSEIEIKKL